MAQSTNTNLDSQGKSNDSNPSSSSDEGRGRARRRKAKHGHKCRQQGNSSGRPPLTVYTPERREDTFWGKAIVRNRPGAIEFAEAVHEKSSLTHLVFWTDGSLKAQKAGGAGVVWTSQPGNEEAWCDFGYGVQGFKSIGPVELVGIGAALRLAAGVIDGSITPKKSPSRDSSLSSESEIDSSSSMSTPTIRKVTIMTDSLSSVELLGGKKISCDETGKEVAKTVIAWSQRLVSLQADIEIEVHWVLAHDARTPCNKRADIMAKAASNLVLGARVQKNRNGTVVAVDAGFWQCP